MPDGFATDNYALLDQSSALDEEGDFVQEEALDRVTQTIWSDDVTKTTTCLLVQLWFCDRL